MSVGATARELVFTSKEARRRELVQGILEKRLTQSVVAVELGVTARQVKRICRRVREEGEAGVISRHRGRPSNRRLAPAVRAAAVALIQEQYADFGPTLAHEKLSTVHGLVLSVEAVRQLMIEAGMHRPKRRRDQPVHQTRMRRPHLGELVQIDGSDHDWFEGRGPRCTLLLFVDDATGRQQYGCFVSAETTLDYMAAMERYLTLHGRPQAFYSDRHSIFRVNSQDEIRGTGLTQVGRALEELGIQLICAHSPQAKGRVERSFATHQDRLVKELRLANINDMDAANHFLAQYLEEHNARFARQPMHPQNMHRALQDPQTQQQVRNALAVVQHRKVSQQLTFSVENQIYRLEPSKLAKRLRGVRIRVAAYPDQHVAVSYQGQELAYSVLREQPRQGRVADGKTLNRSLTDDQRPRSSRPGNPFGRALAMNHPYRKAVGAAFLKKHPSPRSGGSQIKSLQRQGDISTLHE